MNKAVQTEIHVQTQVGMATSSSARALSDMIHIVIVSDSPHRAMTNRK